MRRIAAFFLPLALLVLLAPAAWAKTIKIATIAPEGSMWMKTMDEAAKEIASRTGDRVKFKFFTGGVMGNDRSVMRKIRSGQLDGGMFTLGALAEANPDMLVYSIPFLFPSLKAVDRTREVLDPVLAQGLVKGGFVSFGFSEGGLARLFSKEPADSVNTLRGRKMWIPEGDTIGQTAMENLGLTPVSLPITDVLTGLQTGLIDVVANSSLGALALQWHTATKYVTTTPLLYVAATMAVKTSTFDSLSEGDRAVVREVMEKAYKFFDAKNREDEARAYATLLKEGMKTVDPAPEEISRWRAVAASLGDKLVADGTLSPEIYKKAKALASGEPGAK